jgi:hypothetical protein
LEPQGWNGGIPPVSLVAVVAALVPLLVKRKLEHDKQERAARRRDKLDDEKKGIRRDEQNQDEQNQ